MTSEISQTDSKPVNDGMPMKMKLATMGFVGVQYTEEYDHKQEMIGTKLDINKPLLIGLGNKDHAANLHGGV
jgi:hypothetical protein